MTEREQVTSNTSMSTNGAGSNTTTASNILQTADNVLNTVGGKVADMTGQHETVQKSKPPPFMYFYADREACLTA